MSRTLYVLFLSTRKSGKAHRSEDYGIFCAGNSKEFPCILKLNPYAI
ncbi:MAG: hypothetical protein V1660_00485 [archaeon]